MDPREQADDWRRIAGRTQALVRSKIEIAAILQWIADHELPLLSHHQVYDRLFLTRLHAVSVEQNFILVGFSDNKNANAEVFTAGTVLFGASHRKGHVSFVATNPVVQGEPTQTIRFDFPNVLLIEQRRIDRRIRVVPEAKLHCLADSSGITPFEASIVDIGLSGLGVMVYDIAIILEAGTVLRGCRIDLPGGGVAVVDIEVVHAAECALPDGTPAHRAGCRFIGDAGRIDELLKIFVLDLERHDDDGN